MREAFSKLPAAEWSKVDVAAALRCIPGMALTLTVGLVTGHPKLAVMATAGAFTVGFGSFYRVMESRRVAMIFAALGVAVSSWMGSVAGLTPATSALAAGLWGLLYGVFSEFSDDASWVVLQCVIWFFVSSSAPARGVPALTRAVVVLGGGLIQIPLVVFFWRLSRPPFPKASFLEDARIQIREALKTLSASRWLELYPLQCAITLMVAMLISHRLPWPVSYWIPMTSALVLRPAFADALQRGILRIGGTLCGAGIAASLTLLVHPHKAGLAVLVLVFALGSYLLTFVNYALFTITVTPYIIFLLELSGLSGAALIKYRTLDTILGGALALLGHAVQVAVAGPVRRRVRV
ncbi:MAG: FUSC family protein [Deltaproteobacteria bacterium]|nr:FUSC family protein [Deltaproteobacteria bacterium]